MKHVSQYPENYKIEAGNVVPDHYKSERALRDNVSELKRAIDHFLSEKQTDPKKWAELVDNTELVIAQSVHVYGRHFKMERSTHTGTLIPQYEALKDEANLPIDENTLLRISKGTRIHQNHVNGYQDFVPTFEGKVTVEDPQEKALPVSYSDNLSLTRALMGMAGGKQKDPVQFEIGGIELDPEKNMSEVVLVLKRLVQAFEKFEQGIRNRDKQPEKAGATVRNIAQTQADKIKQLARRLGIK